MYLSNLPALRIGKIEIEKPIIQGGMGVGISLSGLASAVTNQGGLGVISSVALGALFPSKTMSYREANIYYLREEIRRARRLTTGPIGLNIMVAMTDYDELLECALQEQVDVVFLGAGLPLRFPKSIDARALKDSPTHFVPIVSSARATRLIFSYWEKHFPRIPDAVVVEGPLAGGHLGFKPEQIDDPAFRLENIVPEVLTVVREYEERYQRAIPVIPAGGIYTGADIRKYLEMGASGVQMATRFVATYECDASEEFKQSYIQAKKEDIIIIESPVGLPGRAIRNRFLEEVAQGIRRPFRCPWKCLKTCDYKKSPYCIAHALANAQRGRLLSGFTFAGANAYRVDKIVSVKELFQELEAQYLETVAEAVVA